MLYYNESYLFPGLPALAVAAFFALLSPVSSIEEKDIDSASVFDLDSQGVLSVWGNVRV
jgi:hypothetical protein